MTENLKTLIRQRVFRLERKGGHRSEVEFLCLVLKYLPKKGSDVDGKEGRH